MKLVLQFFIYLEKDFWKNLSDLEEDGLTTRPLLNQPGVGGERLISSWWSLWWFGNDHYDHGHGGVEIRNADHEHDGDDLPANGWVLPQHLCLAWYVVIWENTTIRKHFRMRTSSSSPLYMSFPFKTKTKHFLPKPETDCDWPFRRLRVKIAFWK